MIWRLSFFDWTFKSYITYLHSSGKRKCDCIDLAIRIRMNFSIPLLENQTRVVAAAKYSRRALSGGVFCTDNGNPHTCFGGGCTCTWRRVTLYNNNNSSTQWLPSYRSKSYSEIILLCYYELNLVVFFFISPSANGSQKLHTQTI